jgi:hypothetical protein
MWCLGARERDVSFRAGSVGRFAKKHGIEMDFTPVQMNPWRDPREKRFPSRHYMIRLTKPGKEFTTAFSMGFGIAGPPTLSMVLTSTAHDALDLESNRRNFLEYADSFGLDPGDPWEQRHFLDFVEHIDKFRSFLGPEAYNELLYKVPEVQER